MYYLFFLHIKASEFDNFVINIYAETPGKIFTKENFNIKLPLKSIENLKKFGLWKYSFIKDKLKKN